MTKANMKSGGSKRKFKPTKLQLSLVITAIILLVGQYFTLTVFIPLSHDSGVNNFTGAKRAAAQEVYDLVIDSELDNKSRWAYEVSVEDVYPTPEGTCIADTEWSHNKGPNDPRHYTVVVRIKHLFSYSEGVQEAHPGCTKFWLPEIGTGQESQATPVY